MGPCIAPSWTHVTCNSSKNASQQEEFSCHALCLPCRRTDLPKIIKRPERLRAVMTKACDLRWPLPRSTGHSHVQLWRDAGVCRRGRLVKPSHAAGSLGRCMLADAAGYSIKRSSAGRIDRSCAALYAAGKGSRRSTSTRRGNFTRPCSVTAMLVAARRCWLRHDDVCHVPHDGAPTVSRLSPMLVNPCPRLLAVRTARAAAALSFRHAARLLQIHRQLAHVHVPCVPCSIPIPYPPSARGGGVGAVWRCS